MPESAPGPPQPLGRDDLLLAAVQARSAAALGTDDSEFQRSLDNRRFQFRIRLGCMIAAPGTEGAEATYDPERHRVSLSVAPGIGLDHPVVAAVAGEGVEAAEGFWVRRPWLLAPGCVGAPVGQPEIGLVQLFTAAEPRTARRDGRPYETAVTLPEDAEGPETGRWELVLRGRLRRHGDDSVVLCRATAERAVPVCLISVEFDEVAVEDVATGETLAKWGRG